MYMNDQELLFKLPEYSKDKKIDKIYKGKPRIIGPVRDQVEMMTFAIDQLIPSDHKARLVWKYVEKLDLSKFLINMDSVEGGAGRPSIDPRVLLSLWLYATIEGIGQGRVIERYCLEHNAFKWICGGLNISYHTINDFRATNEEPLNELLIQSVTILLDQNLIDLEGISQDGIKVRANAGSSSFRRKETLKELQNDVRAYVTKLNKEREENSSDVLKRKKIIEQQKALDREKRINQAIAQMEQITRKKEHTQKKQRKKLKEKEEKKIRASTTDPESRIMKMGNGGYNPAYNVQLATDIKTHVIVGLEVSNECADRGLMSKMQKQVIDTFKIKPKKWLVDGGYTQHEDVDNVAKINADCKIYMPPRHSQDPKSYVPKEAESSAIKEWRIRMGTIEAKEIYKDRAATSECVNAHARNRGLQQFFVRTLAKVTSNMCIFVLTHNMIRAWDLMN